MSLYTEIESAFLDPFISEIMINGVDDCWIERKGKLEKYDLGVRNHRDIIFFIQELFLMKDLKTFKTYVFDGKLIDGSRIHIVFPPLAMKETSITIRRFVN